MKDAQIKLQVNWFFFIWPNGPFFSWRL